MMLLICCGTLLTALPQSTTTTGNTVSHRSMNNEQFLLLLRNIKTENRPSVKSTLAIEAIHKADNWFTTAQVKQLLEAMPNDTNRLIVARAAYHATTDPENYPSLANVFTSQQHKDALAAFMISRDNIVAYSSYNESYRSPLTDATFNKTYHNISVQWQEGARLSSIIDVFDSPNNFFTSAQVKQMMELISDEGSRLHLAKAAYSKITDPEHFDVLYPLFRDPIRLNNLLTYIGANAHSIQMMHNLGKPAMNDEQFLVQYNHVAQQHRQKLQRAAVHAIFTDPNQFYTSIQAKQLLSFIRNDDKRLEAAKAAYRGIVDPVNFLTEISGLFTSPTQLEALQEYVNNFRG